MKFLRFLCNLLMFFAISFGISCVEVGLYDLTAAQSSDVSAIHIVATDDESVGYIDSYTFWATDIGTNYVQDAKYRVRNWVDADWWKKGMAWSDYAIDAVVATVKPIVVPVAQINAVMNYYGYSVNQFNDQLVASYNGDYKAANDALYQLYNVFGKGYGEAHMIEPGSTIHVNGKDEIHYLSSSSLISDWSVQYNERLIAGIVGERISSRDVEFYSNPSLFDDTTTQYGRWVDRNKLLYNTNWKLTKYNCGAYDKYFKKFISYTPVCDEDGSIIGYADRHIKTAASVLYYQQYVALIVGLVFTLKFPINFFQGRYEGDSVKKKKK